MSGLGGELLAKETTRDLVDYVLAEGWWVSYLWQGKVHLQVLFMMGLLDMKMIYWIILKSLQSVPLYYCLLNIWYASELMTGILENAATFWFRILYGIHEFAQGLKL